MARAYEPVAGFVEEEVADVRLGIGMDFAPDGRIFVAEKDGVLRSVRPDGTTKVVLDISDHVNSHVDRGLTGVAVDADFELNNFVYLLYTWEPFNRNLTGPKRTRLTRIQVNPDDTVANPLMPETVILGTHQPTPLTEPCPQPTNGFDCIPADGTSHVGGTVRAAPDGTLFVGTGDARYGANNNPDPYRPFNELSYAGKILHIDRNGRGLPNHPFCPSNTDLTHVCTKIYAKGFRNPFRFDFASRGGLYAGDVGEARVEEIDHVVAGKSYGWPCYEGNERFAARSGTPTCTALYAQENTPAAQAKPIFTYPHPTGMGAVILAGPEITNDAYGEDVKGSIFFGDINLGFLDRIELEPDGSAGARHRVADDFYGVDFRIGPDGLMYTANFYSISRLKPLVGNRPPVARIGADVRAGAVPLTVNFDASATTDPDGDALEYDWDFGDGTPGSTAAAPAHTYTTEGEFTATLTVTDPSGASDSDTMLIRPGIHAPELTVTAPTDGGGYRNGVPVALSASAEDAEDGDLTSAIEWQVELHHNQHVHFFASPTGGQATFTPNTDHDADSHYEIAVSVRDSDGLVASRRLRIDPETVLVELLTNPAGAAGTVSYGGDVFSWPHVRRSAIGFRTTVSASQLVSKDGVTLSFQGWSDGGARAHEITVPANDLRLTATYASDTTPPDTTLVDAQAVYTTNTPTFTFTSNDPTAKFDCRLDTGGYTSGWFHCESPRKMGPIPNGEHTFRVRAYDPSLNTDPTPATQKFRSRDF